MKHLLKDSIHTTVSRFDFASSFMYRASSKGLFTVRSLLNLSIFCVLVIALSACGDGSSTPQEPNNFPEIKTKQSGSVYKSFGRGVSYKIVTYQQFYEEGGKNPSKQIITLTKPTKGRELKLPLPLDMEKIRKFRRIDASKFEGDGPIDLVKEHQYKNRNQTGYWKYHKDSTSTDVYLQEGSYSFIRLQDFEMLHIYDSKNDIEYMEMMQ